MVAKRFGLAVLVAVALFAMAPLASAQNAGIFCPLVGTTYGGGCDPCGHGFWMGLGVRKFINSFTSTEFPRNLVIPGTTGKARFEWPIDQWYGAVKLGYCRGPVGIAVDYMSTFGSGSGVKAQETYWDPAAGDVDLFGKGTANPRGSVIDIAATWALPIGAAASACAEPACGVSAVVGFRQQNFRFTMKGLHERDADTGLLATYPGAAAEFGQYYTHWYIGGIVTKSFDLGSFFGGYGSCDPMSHQFVVSFQADYAFLKANNNLGDYVHTLRFDNGVYQWENWQQSKGGCWHLNASVAMAAGQCVKIIAEGDFKRINLRGPEERAYYGAPAQNNAEWNTGKSWSDQAYVGLMAAYGF